MTTDKAAAPVGESIPFGVYYSREHHNFYDTATKHGMGNEFFIRWMDRADEFPAKPVAAAPVGAVPQGDAFNDDVRRLINGLPDVARNLEAEGQSSRAEVVADACRAIRRLQAALASQAARMGEWIDVDDQLPEDYGWYHCAVEGVGDLGLARWQEIVSLGHYADFGKRFATAGGVRVTHWKPLGPLPAIDKLRGEAGSS